MTALSETLENWEEGESETTDTLREEIIEFFYEMIAAELKDDLWLKS